MANAPTFSELVNEAFIEPLRSVLIVDDDYPTWEEILNQQISGTGHDNDIEERSAKKRWRTGADGSAEVMKIIREFRERKPGFVIDFHDAIATKPTNGDGLEETVSDLASHLHQSDLLVLDYNLEGTSSGTGGAKAREILQSVLTNNHFNLVIIHTGETSLDQVMGECLISLMQTCTSQFDDNLKNSVDKLDQKLTELGDAENFDRDLIKSNFTDDDYLETRRSEVTTSSVFRSYMRGEGQLAKLYEWGSKTSLTRGELRTFLYWAIREFEKKRLDDFSQEPPEGLSWKNAKNSRWLRTSRGFVSFVKKGPDDLLKELQDALADWKPTPSRLLSAKYRHTLNLMGVAAEDSSLRKKHVFAQFYKDIREPAPPKLSEGQAELFRIYKLKNHVARQSESLSFLIEDEIAKFGIKIIEADSNSGNSYAGHYDVDLSNEKESILAVTQFNNYISTLPTNNHPDQESLTQQLDSGHILKIDNEWWVCATPACDLQPGQTSIAFKGESDELRPFTALRLDAIDTSKLSKEHINSGSYCFVEEHGKIIGLGPRTLTDDKKPMTQKVRWRTFIAERGGLIVGNQLKVKQLELGANEVKTLVSEATVVAKLRYEYALNYIQHVGTSVARIGLGYVTYPQVKD